MEQKNYFGPIHMSLCPRMQAKHGTMLMGYSKLKSEIINGTGDKLRVN